MAKRPMKPSPRGRGGEPQWNDNLDWETGNSGRAARTSSRTSSRAKSEKEDDTPFGERMRETLEETNRIIHTDRFCIVCGLILAAITAYLIVAFVSFGIHGNADSSILSSEFPNAERHNIQNVTGILGARIVFGLVDNAFGWASIVLLYFLTVCTIRLLRVVEWSLWRAFFSTAFLLVWGSIFLGFIHPVLDLSYRLGGHHGQVISEWLCSYIHGYGLSLLLLVTFFVFLICIDRNTIPNIKRFWAWMKSKCNKKDNAETDTDTDDSNTDNQEENSETDDDSAVVIEMTDDTLTSDSENQSENQGEEVGFEIVEAGEETNAEENAGAEQTPDAAAQTETPAKDNITIEITKPKEEEMMENDPDYLLKKLGPYDPRRDLRNYKFPSLDLLKTYPNENVPQIDMDEQKANQDRIISTFRSFGIEIVKIKATIGPTVTLYEIVPKEGTRITRIQSLEKDIMMSLSADGIRMIAPMPGKGTVGIEVPNKKPQIVSMHSVVASKRFQEETKMKLPVVLGKTITNEVFTFDLAKAPHLLVAGATGQGKSVGLNAIVASLLYKKHPSELKFVLVDPKMVEFTIYKDLLKHYMAAMPDQEEIIITNCDKVVNTLNSLVIEMENRYKLLMEAEVRNIEDYNEKFVSRRLNPEKGHRFLPYIVIIIDEFGDFIMQAGKQVETPIARITQKARAVGMHMILATQRPSVNIITGVIKANIPTRIAFRCQSVVDSRTVLDTKGAEGLCGKGDMLYSAGNGTTRLQCAFVDTPEVIEIVHHIKDQPSYPAPYELPEYIPEAGGGDDGGQLAPGEVDHKKLDPMFADVARFVVANQQGSTSVLQRKFQIGYNRAGKLSDQLEAAGIVSPNMGSKGRQVLVQDDITLTRILEELGF